jgi:hypothetical protein
MWRSAGGICAKQQETVTTGEERLKSTQAVRKLARSICS